MLTRTFCGTHYLHHSKYSQLVLKFRKQCVHAEGRSEDNFCKYDFSAAHIPTTAFQKLMLTAGSATLSLFNPARGDMIATLGETTGHRALPYIKEKMESSSEGSEILQRRPRINSRTVDLDGLQKLPQGTVGREYINFLEKNKVTPDSRPLVQFVDDPDLAYVMQRYREVHDLFHTILYMPTNMLGEVTVKWVEGIQTRLPMCIGGAVFGSIRLAPKQRKAYVKNNLPWAIQTGFNADFLMNIYFEKRWEQSMADLHQEFNIVPLKVDNTMNQPQRKS